MGAGREMDIEALQREEERSRAAKEATTRLITCHVRAALLSWTVVLLAFRGTASHLVHALPRGMDWTRAIFVAYLVS